MYKLLFALALSGLLFAAEAAFAQANLQPDTRLRLPPVPGTSGLSEAERTFLDHAIAGASVMADAGQLASQHATNDAIRKLAGDIAIDQQKLEEQVVQLAQSKDYKPGDSTTPPELALLQQLAGKTGADFDRAYLTAQNQAGRWLLGEYQTEMAQTQDLQLRTFAAERELLLRKQVDAVQKAADAMGMTLEAPKNPPQY
ncbi:MAG: DUF4142 domain-containing protein [Acetobacteraceae bacterium]|nr:DUF4142 domain-containing protein [Acetobacteraceae bacterium]MBV8574547.1 DUF4142 domain-containing protein [Acetobacteraceae bacterium]